MNSYSILSLFVIINLTVSTFGAKLGYHVNGVAKGIIEKNQDPSFFETMIEGSWLPGFVKDTILSISDNLEFLWYLTTFQVDNVPIFLSLVFIFMNIMLVFIIIKLIRGIE